MMRDYLFSSFPTPLSTTALWVWGMVAFLLVADSIAVPILLGRRAVPKFRRIPWERLSRLQLATGIFLVIFLFFRVEGIPGLSARWWIGLLILIDLVWLGFILRHVLITVPKQQRVREEQREKQKYLR